MSRRPLPTYQKIVGEIKKHGHEVLSEYVVDPKLKKGDGLSADKLFERETETIGKADLMVAEVTTPSWGTAFLMEHVLKNDKPVLALFYKNHKGEIPMMIKGHPKLYVENYNLSNLRSTLDHYLRFFERQKKKKGKLIVIDGTDGSGKATQSKLLIKALRKKKLKVAHIEFPRYYSSFHGRIVGRFLKGEFGDLDSIDPYIISLAYALDRLTARKQIRDWLEAGYWVVADRYTTASMAHQTAKLPAKKRKKFLAWLDEMEYKQHKIPREDVVVFLHVPVETSSKLVTKKTKRKYTGKKQKDIAEENLRHQKETLKVYLKLAREKEHWMRVDCVDKKGKMRTRKNIHKEILERLRERKIFKTWQLLIFLLLFLRFS